MLELGLKDCIRFGLKYGLMQKLPVILYNCALLPKQPVVFVEYAKNNLLLLTDLVCNGILFCVVDIQRR